MNATSQSPVTVTARSDASLASLDSSLTGAQALWDGTDKKGLRALLPADSKGVMVALRPAPGLRVEQALTLCKPNRMGDIMTIGNNRLVLFLSFCRINDLDTALNHIFPLPTGDIFSNRMVWFEDKQILSEIVIMRGVEPARWNTPLPLSVGKNETINATHDGRHWRRYPEPLRLTTREEQA